MSEQSLPPVNHQMTITEVTALVQLFNSQLLEVERRLGEKMDGNSAAAAERWARHDAELQTNTARIVARFEKIEEAMLTVEKALEQHLDGHHDEDLVMDARLRPVRSGAQWLIANYKNIAILLIGLLGFFAVAADILSRYLGGAP